MTDLRAGEGLIRVEVWVIHLGEKMEREDTEQPHIVVTDRVASSAVRRDKTRPLTWSQTFGEKRDEQLSKYM